MMCYDVLCVMLCHAVLCIMLFHASQPVRFLSDPDGAIAQMHLEKLLAHVTVISASSFLTCI